MPKLVQTPGTVLKSLLDEHQLTPAKTGQAIGLSTSAVYQITIGKTRVTAPVAIRLAKFFGLTPAYWLDLQNTTDLADIAKDGELQGILKSITKAKKPSKAAAAKAAKEKAPAQKTTKKPAKAKAAKSISSNKAAAAESMAAEEAEAEEPIVPARKPARAAAPKKTVKPRAKKALNPPPPPPIPFKPDTILIKQQKDPLETIPDSET